MTTPTRKVKRQVGSGLYPGQAEAHDQFQREVARLHEAGETIPCLEQDGPRWTSDAKPDRVHAATQCRQCPLLHACNRYATDWKEITGVWGGRYRG